MFSDLDLRSMNTFLLLENISISTTNVDFFFFFKGRDCLNAAFNSFKM